MNRGPIGLCHCYSRLACRPNRFLFHSQHPAPHKMPSTRGPPPYQGAKKPRSNSLIDQVSSNADTDGRHLKNATDRRSWLRYGKFIPITVPESGPAFSRHGPRTAHRRAQWWTSHWQHNGGYAVRRLVRHSSVPDWNWRLAKSLMSTRTPPSFFAPPITRLKVPKTFGVSHNCTAADCQLLYRRRSSINNQTTAAALTTTYSQRISISRDRPRSMSAS